MKASLRLENENWWRRKENVVLDENDEWLTIKALEREMHAKCWLCLKHLTNLDIRVKTFRLDKYYDLNIFKVVKHSKAFLRIM